MLSPGVLLPRFRLSWRRVAPELSDIRANLIANLIETEPLLTRRLFVLADCRILAASLIDRNTQTQHNRTVEQLLRRDVRVVLLLNVSLQSQCGVKPRLCNLDLQLGYIDAVHRRSHGRILNNALR